MSPPHNLPRPYVSTAGRITEQEGMEARSHTKDSLADCHQIGDAMVDGLSAGSMESQWCRRVGEQSLTRSPLRAACWLALTDPMHQRGITHWSSHPGMPPRSR